MIASRKKKIWIDLDNSPHVPFFKPIIEELNRRGYSVMLTARDCFQVCALADRFNLSYKRIGRHYGKNKILKITGLLLRALQMSSTVLSEKPDLAVSHGSRTQLLLASIFGIPSVLICDYEHAKGLVLTRRNWVLLPEVIPHNAIKLHKKRILKYPGIKEDVYVPTFVPDPRIREEIGIQADDLVVTIRPPATEAHYHNPESDKLFYAVVEFLGRHPDVRMVILPRNEIKQTAFVKKTWPEWCATGKIIIPAHVVNGLNLIWHSDLVVSGGGTMNREAAALGVPVYSIFRGKIGAVDRYLSNTGRLTLLETIEDVRTKIGIVRRKRSVNLNHGNRKALEQIVDHIIALLEGT